LRDLVRVPRCLAVITFIMIAVAEAELDDLGSMAVAGCVVPDDQRTFRLDLVAVADPDVGAGQHELPRCHSADRGDWLIVIVMVESFGQTRKQPARIMKSVEVLAAADRVRGRMAVQALKRYLDVLLELGLRIPRRRRGEVAACGEIAVGGGISA
jgi:hypothetical protein